MLNAMFRRYISLCTEAYILHPFLLNIHPAHCKIFMDSPLSTASNPFTTMLSLPGAWLSTWSLHSLVQGPNELCPVDCEKGPGILSRQKLERRVDLVSSKTSTNDPAGEAMGTDTALSIRSARSSVTDDDNSVISGDFYSFVSEVCVYTFFALACLTYSSLLHSRTLTPTKRCLPFPI